MSLQSELLRYMKLKENYAKAESRLYELRERAASVGSAPLDGAPRGSGIGNPTEKWGCLIVDAAIHAETTARDLILTEKDLTVRIQAIPASKTRLYLTLHYLRGRTWDQVARFTGTDETGNACARYTQRFLEVYDNGK